MNSPMCLLDAWQEFDGSQRDILYREIQYLKEWAGLIGQMFGDSRRIRAPQQVRQRTLELGLRSWSETLRARPRVSHLDGRGRFLCDHSVPEVYQ
jgi:hypothetical protein